MTRAARHVDAMALLQQVHDRIMRPLADRRRRRRVALAVAMLKEHERPLRDKLLREAGITPDKYAGFETTNRKDKRQ